MAALSDSHGAAVLQAWDALQSEKVAARTTVGDWTVEFVLRKVSESSAGDCYAKCAGRPRVRSRVALLAMLGMTDAAGQEEDRVARCEAHDERGAASSSGAVEAEDDDLEGIDESAAEAAGGRVGGEATGAVEAALAACKEARACSVSAWTRAVLAADVVMQLAPGRDLSADMEWAEGDEAPLTRPGKARRPPGASLDLWRLQRH